MGRKVEREQPPGPAAQGADDLQILHPEREIEVAGRKLTVREYGFVEGLRLRPMIQPLLDDLYAISQGAVLPTQSRSWWCSASTRSHPAPDGSGGRRRRRMGEKVCRTGMETSCCTSGGW
ncbi:hypothetical protein P4050_15915 [Pseudomonas aeruginosa]|nr:hypothetical protein [Pseudomonas aeruginosa]